MAKSKMKKFIMNVGIMTVTSILLRIISVNFSVYISNKIGEEGIGLYQLLMSVYRLGVTFASSGIAFASTRIIAEEIERKNYNCAKKAAGKCLVISVTLGIAVSVFMVCFADHIGNVWLGDARTVRSIYFLAISLPFIVASSVLGGYSTAVRRVSKNAATLFFEQFIRITLTIYFLTFFFPANLEYACLSIVIGGVISEIASFIFSYTLYCLDKRRLYGENAKCENINRRIFNIALPVALSSYIRSGLNTVEHLMIPSGLKKSGMNSANALSLYGVITGMAMPVVMFPTAFLYAFSDLLVPEFASFNTTGDERRINRVATKVMQLTSLFSIGVSGIMMKFADRLGDILYESEHAGFFIKALSPLIFVMLFDHLIDAVLKGINEQISVVKYNVIDSAVSVALVWILIPKFGIGGYLFVIYFGEILNSAMSTYKFIKRTGFKFKFVSFMLKPLVCVIVSSNFAAITTSLLPVSPAAELVIGIGLAAVIYLILLRLIGCIEKSDNTVLKKAFKG